MTEAKRAEASETASSLEGEAPAPAPSRATGEVDPGAAVLEAPCLVLVSQDLLPRCPAPERPVRRYRVAETLGAILLECTEETEEGEHKGRATIGIARLYARPEGRLTVGEPLLGLQGEAALLMPGTLIMPSQQGTRRLAEVMDVRRWCTEDVCCEDMGAAMRFTSGVCLRNAAVGAVAAAAMAGFFDAFTFSCEDAATT